MATGSAGFHQDVPLEDVIIEKACCRVTYFFISGQRYAWPNYFRGIMAKTYFIADLHLTEQRSDITQAFFAFLDTHMTRTWMRYTFSATFLKYGLV